MNAVLEWLALGIPLLITDAPRRLLLMTNGKKI